MEEFMHQVAVQMTEYGPRIIWALILFIIFYIASWIVSRLIRGLGKRVDVHQVVADLIAQVFGTTILILGIISGLGTLGIDVTALVAGLGLAGFAVGFAVKDILSNVMSGMLILYYRPFWVDDRIKVSGHEGVITDIDLRYTSLQTENSMVLLPNASLFTNGVEILNKKAHNEAQKSVTARQADEAQKSQ